MPSDVLNSHTRSFSPSELVKKEVSIPLELLFPMYNFEGATSFSEIIYSINPLELGKNFVA